MRKFAVKLRLEKRRVLKATVVIEADSESEAMDVAHENARDSSIAITWRDTTFDDVDERAPENIEVVEAEEIEEEELR